MRMLGAYSAAPEIILCPWIISTPRSMPLNPAIANAALHISHRPDPTTIVSNKLLHVLLAFVLAVFLDCYVQSC